MAISLVTDTGSALQREDASVVVADSVADVLSGFGAALLVEDSESGVVVSDIVHGDVWEERPAAARVVERQMPMALSAVAGRLEGWARSSDADAMTVRDFREVVVHVERARVFKDMARSVRLAIASGLSVADVVAPAGKPTARAKSKVAGGTAGRVAKPAKVAPLGALAFWQLHGEAVARIRSDYGDMWRVAAPFGKTELVTLASGLRSCVTERGTKLRWNREQRMPAAEYWTGGTFPPGVVVEADYARHQFQSPDKYAIARKEFAGLVRGRAWHERGSDKWLVCDGKARELLATLRAMPRTRPVAIKPVAHDAAWHEARGYVLHNGNWVSELGLRANQSRTDQIAADRQAVREAEAVATGMPYGPPQAFGPYPLEAA